MWLFSSKKRDPEQYRYRRLRTGHTRVIDLKPGRFQDALCIRVCQTKLKRNAEHDFITLSYVWGSEKKPAKVWVDTPRPRSSRSAWTYIRITANLDEALRYLRKKHKSILLWVDAICINQNDVIERGQQVQLMPLIYRNAVQTIIWLGTEVKGTEEAFALLKDWSRHVYIDRSTNDTRLKDPANTEYAWVESNMKCLPASAPMQDLLSRPWFSRLWVGQEVYLSRAKALVRCGNQIMKWKDFSLGAVVYCRYTKDEIMPRAQRHITENVCYISGGELHVILGECRAAECTDPRDKIYACLGMLGKSHSNLLAALAPDYTLAVTDLYKSVVKQRESLYGRLDLLRYCEFTTSSDLPSWCPDWRVQRTTLYVLDFQHASLGMLACAEVAKHVLYAQGISVATVVDVMQFKLLPTEEKAAQVFTELRRLYKALRSKLKLSKETLIKIFTRLIANNRLSEEQVLASNQTSTYFSHEHLSTCLETLLESERDQVDLMPARLQNGIGRLLSGFKGIKIGRAIAIFDTGKFGLVPAQTQDGDMVVTLMGFNSTLVLRPQDNSKYQVVGTSFVPGYEWGEALVGSLPEGWNPIRDFRRTGKAWSPAFRDMKTDTLSALDPRINYEKLEVSNDDYKLSLWERRCSEEYGKPVRKPDPEYLIKHHGAKVETFELIRICQLVY